MQKESLKSAGKTLLALIKDECKEGVYQVFDSSYLIGKLEGYYSLELTDLKDIIDYLSQENYIIVKYADTYEYCFLLLDKGRIVAINNRKSGVVQEKPSKKSHIFAFWGAFCGAIVAYLIIEFVIKPIISAIGG